MNFFFFPFFTPAPSLTPALKSAEQGGQLMWGLPLAAISSGRPPPAPTCASGN